MEENRNKVTKDVKEGGLGRKRTAAQQEQGQQFGNEGRQEKRDKEIQDISDIDQQEGNMNNGTIGIDTGATD